MSIETRLNIGDKMFIIEKYSEEGFIPCDACNATGLINLNSERYNCPKCYGRKGEKEYLTKQWNVFTHAEYGSKYEKVGKINIEIEGKNMKVKYSPKGMGNFYYEENVFKTREEAQSECDKRNQELVG